ncbi:hypothetical protein QWY31_00310 [Cytophagales bacterium LB-30]|uniref:TerB family tellurite resistance protein n=1 Tax=Shiella aurantiaca TaxID=3058365 RepID=A0ABT8F0F8_9BACT|nr:hypothetical protein [Shiella aurantiaca]MDN4163917.1 hypothetical protein [Shiella aurantiaca]
MNQSLSPEVFNSIKRSYFNILSFFLGKEAVESKYVKCLVKWAIQLHLNPKDLSAITGGDFDTMIFETPTSKIDKMEAVYHLVYMIYLDHVVEDIELEVATIYAQQLGFESYVVGELLKNIASAPFDGQSLSQVRVEVQEFLKLYDI